MPALMLQCRQCGSLFSSGIAIEGNATVNLQGNRSQCPYCGSMEQVPDGTFRNTVEGIVKVLSASSNPLQTVKQVLHDLEKAKKNNDVSSLDDSVPVTSFKQWLPNTPEKLAAYIAIFYTIYLLLSRQPAVNIEYNKIFINQYNSVIIENPVQLGKRQPKHVEPKKKIGRNEPCPCGSGKKYKKCCLLKNI
jgi:hypothetical protein